MEVTKNLKKIISEKTGIEPERILPASQFEQDLNLSKAELAELFSSLEDQFRISFEKEDIDSVVSFADLETLIKDRTNEI